MVSLIVSHGDNLYTPEGIPLVQINRTSSLDSRGGLTPNLSASLSIESNGSHVANNGVVNGGPLSPSDGDDVIIVQKKEGLPHLEKRLLICSIANDSFENYVHEQINKYAPKDMASFFYNVTAHSILTEMEKQRLEDLRIAKEREAIAKERAANPPNPFIVNVNKIGTLPGNLPRRASFNLPSSTPLLIDPRRERGGSFHSAIGSRPHPYASPGLSPVVRNASVATFHTTHGVITPSNSAITPSNSATSSSARNNSARPVVLSSKGRRMLTFGTGFPCENGSIHGFEFAKEKRNAPPGLEARSTALDQISAEVSFIFDDYRVKFDEEYKRFLQAANAKKNGMKIPCNNSPDTSESSEKESSERENPSREDSLKDVDMCPPKINSTPSLCSTYASFSTTKSVGSPMMSPTMSDGCFSMSDMSLQLSELDNSTMGINSAIGIDSTMGINRISQSSTSTIPPDLEGLRSIAESNVVLTSMSSNGARVSGISNAGNLLQQSGTDPRILSPTEDTDESPGRKTPMTSPTSHLFTKGFIQDSAAKRKSISGSSDMQHTLSASNLQQWEASMRTLDADTKERLTHTIPAHLVAGVIEKNLWLHALATASSEVRLLPPVCEKAYAAYTERFCEHLQKLRRKTETLSSFGEIYRVVNRIDEGDIARVIEEYVMLWIQSLQSLTLGLVKQTKEECKVITEQNDIKYRQFQNTGATAITAEDLLNC